MSLRINAVTATYNQLGAAGDVRVILEKRRHGNAPGPGEGRTGIAGLGRNGEGADSEGGHKIEGEGRDECE